MAAVLDVALDERLHANQRMQRELEEMEARLMEFLEETKLDLYPGLEDVSCRCIPEHRVPPVALDRHRKRCHGIDVEDRAPSHEFFYEKMPYVENVRGSLVAERAAPEKLDVFAPSASTSAHFLHLDNAYFEPEEDALTDVSTTTVEDEVPSLIERSTAKPLDVQSAVLALAPNAVEFVAAVDRWHAIPAGLQRLETAVVQGTHEWVAAYFATHLPLPEVDTDLTEYVLGLLDHPDFCHPDILVAELTEFLEGNTMVFVLALWKWLVIEVARTRVYCDARSQDELRALASRPPPPPIQKPALIPPPATVEATGKRRRVSYRAKNAKRNYKEVVRELLDNRMAELAQRDGWTIVKSVTEDGQAGPMDAQSSSHEERAAARYLLPFGLAFTRPSRRRDLMQLRDPLEVRNYDRDQARRRSRSRETRSSRETRRSRSREPRRSRSREYRRRKRSRSSSRDAKRRRHTERY
ncbi:hypothetical protein ACHHYP_04985 [Achlya hypogyna]|uniref:PWI domain-containing protein n=1 Tax=Achlya hypogyna TaxID=1202772 RepID=A0A1V9YZL0_ACHHY|nr:hypothetical protein ACHHYP_04985 [Achlya hypogyna]